MSGLEWKRANEKIPTASLASRWTRLCDALGAKSNPTHPTQFSQQLPRSYNMLVMSVPSAFLPRISLLESKDCDKFPMLSWLFYIVEPILICDHDASKVLRDVAFWQLEGTQLESKLFHMKRTLEFFEKRFFSQSSFHCGAELSDSSPVAPPSNLLMSWAMSLII